MQFQWWWTLSWAKAQMTQEMEVRWLWTLSEDVGHFQTWYGSHAHRSNVWMKLARFDVLVTLPGLWL